MGRIGNSFSHLILGLSQILQDSGGDSSAQTLSDASLQTFAFMSRELGRLMSTVTLACCQVWLAQAPLSEGCRRTLRSLPVVPCRMFGPAAQQAVERSAQVDQARQQFASLRRGPVQAPRRMDLLPSGPNRSHPPARPVAQTRSSPEEGWQVSPDPGSAGAEQVFKSPAIPHVADGRCSPVSDTRCMVCVDRPQRCLFLCAYCSTPQAVPEVCISRQGLSIQGVAIRSLTGPSHIYKVYGSGTLSHTGQGFMVGPYLDD
ncbi:uncharacterized protein LOC131986285 [Centropristis striata]|uniref:uncharacterized protein LOC131986285 n=1 Tax=Centropristis striata TaxID=184440 RepID=UPI0027E1C621|nr:uncharacterized protein LOC131986285 [Centropristis striata]